MNSWEIIKERLTVGKRQGSAGYMAALYHAAMLFTDLLSLLEDEADASAAFNEDAEVTRALMNAGNLREAGLL